jgi:hypothetical protein
VIGFGYARVYVFFLVDGGGGVCLHPGHGTVVIGFARGTSHQPHISTTDFCPPHRIRPS